MSRQERHRNWFITFQVDAISQDNDPVVNALEALSQIQSTVCVRAQLECAPTTNQLHVQAMFTSTSQRTLSAVQKLFRPLQPHLDPITQTTRVAYDYCGKADSRVEGDTAWSFQYGTPPVGAGKRTHLDAFNADVAAGTLTSDSLYERHSKVHALYPAYVSKYITYYTISHTYYSAPKQVYVVTGPTGTGKTRFVHGLHQALFSATCTKGQYWFDGYDGQPVVLFDEFDGPLTVSLASLLKLLDRYPLRLPIKGGFTAFIPTCIFLVNNQPIQDWCANTYPGTAPAAIRALERRVTTFVDATATGWEQQLSPFPSLNGILATK